MFRKGTAILCYFRQSCEAKHVPEKNENNFNLIRVCAAVFVILAHSFALLKKDDPLTKIANSEGFGSLGVCIFFVISGYLITKSFMNSSTKFSFIRSRILRICPALSVVVLLAVFVLGPCLTKLSIGEYFTNPRTWSYLQNIFLTKLQFDLPGLFSDNPFPHSVNGSLWTLPIEVFCYLLTFLAGCLFFFKRRVFLLLSFLGLLLFEWTVMSKDELGSQSFLWLGALSSVIKFAVYYFAGTVIYLFRDKLKLNNWISLIFVAILIGSAKTPYFQFIECLVLPYLVIWLAFQRNPLVLKYNLLGDYSYGLYIFAFPIQQTIWHFLRHVNVTQYFLLSFILTLPAAILSWKLVENPFLALKKRKRDLSNVVPAVQAEMVASTK